MNILHVGRSWQAPLPPSSAASAALCYLSISFPFPLRKFSSPAARLTRETPPTASTPTRRLRRASEAVVYLQYMYTVHARTGIAARERAHRPRAARGVLYMLCTYVSSRLSI